MTYISVMNVLGIQIGPTNQLPPSMYLEKTLYTVEICLQTKAGEFRLVAFSENPESLKIDLKQTKPLGVAA